MERKRTKENNPIWVGPCVCEEGHKFARGQSIASLSHYLTYLGSVVIADGNCELSVFPMGLSQLIMLYFRYKDFY